MESFLEYACPHRYAKRCRRACPRGGRGATPVAPASTPAPISLPAAAGGSPKLRFAFEFRHQSFCDEKIYNLLKRHNCAWVIADSSRYPKAEAITADFVYIRMHGPGELFASKYTTKELRDLAKKIKSWHKQGKDIYVYFNNDFGGYALENAKTLLQWGQSPKKGARKPASDKGF